MYNVRKDIDHIPMDVIQSGMAHGDIKCNYAIMQVPMFF